LRSKIHSEGRVEGEMNIREQNARCSSKCDKIKKEILWNRGMERGLSEEDVEYRKRWRLSTRNSSKEGASEKKEKISKQESLRYILNRQ
jgi:hypothetical protein